MYRARASLPSIAPVGIESKGPVVNKQIRMHHQSHLLVLKGGLDDPGEVVAEAINRTCWY